MSWNEWQKLADEAGMLPCPFCGCTKLEVYDDSVWCVDCSAATVVSSAKIEDSIAAWNRRTQWQPIETAPKDGTRVDLWAGERIFNALWRCPSPEVHGDDPECFTWWAPQCEDVGSWGEVWEEGPIGVNPTHWMPLPAPPEVPHD